MDIYPLRAFFILHYSTESHIKAYLLHFKCQMIIMYIIYVNFFNFRINILNIFRSTIKTSSIKSTIIGIQI